MKNSTTRSKIVVVGGGFAGIEVVRRLAKERAFDVTLVSNNSCFQYYPSLYRLVVGATVNQVSIPLRRIVPKRATLLIDTYMSVDPIRKCIVLKSGTEVAYDYVVMALGSEPNYFGIDGMETHSKSFLSITKATALNAYFLDLIEQSKTMGREEAAMKLHTIIVGAGPSGVELAGALPSYLKKHAKKHGVDASLITVDLLDSGARVLPAIPENASALVTEQLKKKGVTIYSNYGVNACDEDCVIAANKNIEGSEPVHMKAGTIIWTAGTKINGLFSAIPGVVMTEKKRVTVTPTLTLPSDDTIYIIGDGSGTPFSGLAQTAIDQGKYIAMALQHRINGNAVSDYVPKQGVFVIPVGRGWAILNYKTLVLHGLTPWVMRIMVDARYFLSITSPWHVISMLFKKKSTI